MTSTPWPEGRYTTALLVLTAATGAIDAVSYLILDRVFTGNMTGNVLFIAFGLIGVQEIPVLNNVVALLAFMLGAVVVSRVVRKSVDPGHLPKRALVSLICGTALALLVATSWLVIGELSGPLLLTVTGLLAFLLGGQASAVKSIGIRDLSTVVVTMTMVNLSTDSRLAGGRGADWLRRTGGIIAMGLGALLSALFCLHVGGATALLFAVLLMAVGVLLMWRARRAEASLRSGTSMTHQGSSVASMSS